MGDIATFEAYLVLKRSSRWRWDLQGRMVTNKPTRLAKGEVPVRLLVKLPWALFNEPPILTVQGEASVSPSSDEMEAALIASGLGVVVVREPALTPGPSPATGEGSEEDSDG